MRIRYEELKEKLYCILSPKYLSAEDAEAFAGIVAENTLCGVNSHGVNRFLRTIRNIEDGYIDVNAETEVLFSLPFYERWDAHLGLGPLKALSAMKRAVLLAKEKGIGVVALRNNNHWLRAGTYSSCASSAGLIGICFTNTIPNMPCWGSRKENIGNNPLSIAVPRKDGPSFLLDSAMSQFSYGKLEVLRRKGLSLPFPGGFDDEGNLTTDPSLIEKSRRSLPIGYWKGSALSIAIDLIASVLSAGNSVKDNASYPVEMAVSQIFIAISPERLGLDAEYEKVSATLSYLTSADPAEGFPEISYPGAGLERARKENIKNGIEIDDEIWSSIMALQS